jgi:hypothetical protein
MFASDAYSIRPATEADEQQLLRLSVLDSQPELTTPALIGEIDGKPAAAMSLSTGRVVADPFASTEALVAHLRVRGHALQAHRRGTLADRVRGIAPIPRAPRYGT